MKSKVSEVTAVGKRPLQNTHEVEGETGLQSACDKLDTQSENIASENSLEKNPQKYVSALLDHPAIGMTEEKNCDTTGQEKVQASGLVKECISERRPQPKAGGGRLRLQGKTATVGSGVSGGRVGRKRKTSKVAINTIKRRQSEIREKDDPPQSYKMSGKYWLRP